MEALFIEEPDEIPPAYPQPSPLHLVAAQTNAVRAIEEFRIQVEQIREIAGAIQVESPSSQAQAERVKAVAMKLIKAVEARAKELTADYDTMVKAVKNTAAGLVAPLKEAKSILESKSHRYHEAQRLEAQRRQQEEAAALAKLQEEMNTKAAELKVEAPVLPTPVIPKETPIRTDHGTTYVKKTWAFEVEDISQVPRNYLVLNTAMVNQMIKAGVRDIPGLKIYEKETLVTRTN